MFTITDITRIIDNRELA